MDISRTPPAQPSWGALSAGAVDPSKPPSGGEPTRLEHLSNELLVEIFDHLDPGFRYPGRRRGEEARGIAVFTGLNRRFAEVGRHHAVAEDLARRARCPGTARQCADVVKEALALPVSLRLRVLHTLVEAVQFADGQAHGALAREAARCIVEEHPGLLRQDLFLKLQIHAFARKDICCPYLDRLHETAPLSPRQEQMLQTRFHSARVRTLSEHLAHVEQKKGQDLLMHSLAGVCTQPAADVVATIHRRRIDAWFAGLEPARQATMLRALAAAIRSSSVRHRPAHFEALLLLYGHLAQADRGRHTGLMEATARHVPGGFAQLAALTAAGMVLPPPSASSRVPPDILATPPVVPPDSEPEDGVQVVTRTRLEQLPNEVLQWLFDYVDPCLADVAPDDKGARGVAAFTSLNRRLAHAGRDHAAAARILAAARRLATPQHCQALVSPLLQLPAALQSRVLHALMELMRQHNGPVHWAMRECVVLLLLEHLGAAVRGSEFIRVQLHELVLNGASARLEKAVRAEVPLTSREEHLVRTRFFRSRLGMLGGYLSLTRHREPDAWASAIAGACSQPDTSEHELLARGRIGELFEQMDDTQRRAMSRELLRAIRTSLQINRELPFLMLLRLHEKMPDAERRWHVHRLAAAALHVPEGPELLAAARPG
ncbi:hypothetical protein GT347_15855 [Xylophilus rhododendri]|uniref:Uncharacterized protein n=1 Tax=Xylophilus rhododendri TaxID=2697032 RepID=A0A857J8C1_9BURK|nr:hypothetical protein [Xylophilus rhododendri]QHI99321.1 hypothetical protein GT347_15855 [Xylophilus rhododendri]